MGIRVRVRIEYGGKHVDATALLNTGYEAEVPEIMVPVGLAERLGVWPRLPEEALVETYKTASGLMRVYRVRGAKVYLLLDGEARGPVAAYLVISEYVDEPLINDQLISSLGIIIEDPARGIWRLRGEA